MRGWTWGPALRHDGTDRLALLVHGWSGRGSQLAGFAVPLVEAGFTVATFDAIGHGESGGSSSSLVELSDACFAVARALRAAPAVAVGHSMGAAALGLAMSEGLPVERAAWICPPASMRHFVDEFASFMGFGDRTSEGIVAHMNERYSVDLDDYEIERMAVAGGERVMIVHDAADREVPIEQGVRVHEALEGSRLVTTNGLGHRRILRDEDVQRRVSRWLAKR